MEKEKGVIIEEINMYDDMPQSVVQEEFQSLLYGDTPAGWSIAGPRENIKKMKKNNAENRKNEKTGTASEKYCFALTFDGNNIWAEL